ncbi:MAG: MFS transporter [Bacillota bacterium]|nr:MFS transporter [Bacillota bacterium]
MRQRLQLLWLADQIPDGVIRQNAHNSLADGAFFAAAQGLTNPFLGPFVIALGGSDVHVGLVTAAPALGGLVGQLPAVWLTERSPARMPVVLAYTLAHRLFFLFFAALPFLEGMPRAWLLVIGLGLAMVPATVTNTAWTTLMGDLFPGRLRAQIFADRNVWVALATLAGSAMAGPLLDALPPRWNWWALFLLAFGCLMGSYVFLARLREGAPAGPVRDAAAGRARAGPRGYADILRNREFLSFLVPVAVFYGGMMLAAPMYPIIYVRKLHLANSWIASFSLLSGICSVATYRYWGRACVRWGSRYVFALAAAAHVTFPMGYALAGSPYVLLFWSAVGGIFGAAFNLALFNLLLDVSAGEGRPRYVGAYNLAINGTTLLFPMLGVAAYMAWGLYVAMGISTAGRLLGTALLARGARPARTAIPGRGAGVPLA